MKLDLRVRECRVGDWAGGPDASAPPDSNGQWQCRIVPATQKVWISGMATKNLHPHSLEYFN